MKKKDNLFQLIKSLSKSEKRFFKIYSERHVIGERNNYVRLFDVLDKQRKYSEKAILKKFANEKFIRRLAVAKSYLYDLILKSMNMYHAQHSIDAQIRELLGNVQFLYQKSLYQQSNKLLNKAKKLVNDYEKWSFLVEILRWQKKLLDAQSYHQIDENELKKLHESYRLLLAKLLNINDFWLLQSKLQYYHTQKGMIGNAAELNDIKALISDDLLQSESQAESYESKLLFYKIYASYYFMVRDFAKCYEYSKKLVLMIEHRPNLLQVEPMLYVQSVNNLLNMAAPMGKAAESSYYLDSLHKMRNEKKFNYSLAVQIKLFQAYYYHSLIQCSQGHFEQGLALAKQMENELKAYQRHIDSMGLAMLCFYAFQVCFGAADFSYAHFWLTQILALESSEVRQDIYHFTKILLLITVYEMNDLALLRSTIISTYRFLYTQKASYQLDKLIIAFLRQLTDTTNETQLKAMFIQILEDLQALKQDNFERKVFAYFDFIAWTKSNINDESFAKTIATAKKTT
ncbi:MAG: hypothetical protein ACPG5B_10705 [Chitinophagales bacterium]